MSPATEPSTTGSINQASSGGDVAEDFGANDWLLEEMYERYTADPSSVDASWVKYFSTHDHPTDEPGSTADNGHTTGNGSRTKPTPPAAREPSPPPQSPNQPVSGGAPKKAPAAARPAATVEKGISVRAERPTSPGKGGGVPADPPNPSHRPSVALQEPVRSTLRGAPAATAKNMDISLTVPTATSVRSLPVKLLIDQRVVINNHLRRARGGKVSYTHLIGYAMVQALKTHARP